MIKTVWKYWLDQPVNAVMMPKNAEIVGVGMQTKAEGPAPVLWALVDPEAQPEQRNIVVLGTGSQIDTGGLRMRHLGIARVRADEHVSGELVWHVFEVTMPPKASELNDLDTADGLGA